MKNFGHHDEFDDSGLTLADLKEKIEKKEVCFQLVLIKKIRINNFMIINSKK